MISILPILPIAEYMHEYIYINNRTNAHSLMQTNKHCCVLGFSVATLVSKKIHPPPTKEITEEGADAVAAVMLPLCGAVGAAFPFDIPGLF